MRVVDNDHGVRCPGPVFCHARMREAAELARAGKLESHGPARVVIVCAACSEYNGRRWACANPAHRCQRRDGDGKQCQWAVELDAVFCEAHLTRPLPRSNGGRKPILSDAQIAEAIKRHDSGKIWSDIANSVGIGKQALSASIKRYRDKYPSR